MSDRRVAALYLRTLGGAAVSDRRAPRVRHNSQERGAGLRRLLAERKWDAGTVYDDHAVSNRVRWPQFDALRSNARRGEFNVVVVEHLGKITRSLSDLLETLDEFARLGIDLVAVEDDIDTTEAGIRGNPRNLVAALLRAGRTVRSELSSAALAGIRTAGTKSGRPFGRPRLEIDRDRIRALRDQDRPYSQIAERMGVSVSLVRRELARHQQSTDVNPTPAQPSGVELTTAASTAPNQPGFIASSAITPETLEPHTTQAGMAFGNAPYQRESGRP